uniref:Receptor ligand binding region domain-containing protein n=1 Tax=Plectus sambesii TaxID=2011161 RepID=A0A914W8U3_9BILA
MLLFVILSLASRSNAMTLEVGEKTIEVPVTFSFVGSAQCLNSSHCGNTKGSDFWTLGAIAAAYEDINKMPSLDYFHNMTISFFDLINTGKRSIESTVDAASVPNSLGIIGLPDTCLDEATIAGVHDKVAVSEGCHFNLASYGDFDKVFVQLANSPSAYAMGVRAFVQRYGWRHVVVLSPSDGMETYFVKSRDQLIVELRTAGIHIVADVRLPAIEPEQDPTAAIADYARTIANTYLSTRIYVIFDPNHNAPMLRWTLSVMGRMGLLQTGE